MKEIKKNLDNVYITLFYQDNQINVGLFDTVKTINYHGIV